MSASGRNVWNIRWDGKSTTEEIKLCRLTVDDGLHKDNHEENHEQEHTSKSTNQMEYLKMVEMGLVMVITLPNQTLLNIYHIQRD